MARIRVGDTVAFTEGGQEIFGIHPDDRFKVVAAKQGRIELNRVPAGLAGRIFSEAYLVTLPSYVLLGKVMDGEELTQDDAKYVYAEMHRIVGADPNGKVLLSLYDRLGKESRCGVCLRKNDPGCVTRC